MEIDRRWSSELKGDLFLFIMNVKPMFDYRHDEQEKHTAEGNSRLEMGNGRVMR
jgi:hypothetical protein